MTTVLARPRPDGRLDPGPSGIASAVARTPVRHSWALSPTGRVAACVVSDPGGARLEVHHDGDVRTVAVPALSPFTQLVVRDDGVVVLCRHRDDAHVVERADADGGLSILCRTRRGGFWLAPTGGRLLAVHTVGGRSDLLELGPRGLRWLAALAAPVVDVVALTPERLAVTVRAEGGTAALDLDLGTGVAIPLLDLDPGSDEAVVAALPEAGLVVVSTTATGTVRLGFGPLDGRIGFPEALVGGRLLAVADDGSVLAVSRDHGSSTTAHLVDTTSWTSRAVSPAGHAGAYVVHPGAALHDGRLTAVVSTSEGSRPAQLVTGSRVCRARPRPAAEVREVRLAGVPCLVHGDPDTTDDVVVALHGGPAAAWRVGYDPLVAALRASGAAVVAVNVRGSTGYGPEHQAATRGAWGRPDRDDVQAVAERLVAARPAGARRPLLVGSSYGAWLALVSAGAGADLFSGVVALSPFLSGARLLADGGPHATLVERLGGQDAADLREACRRLPLPVLLVHGGRDETIDPAHSRLLARALALGGTPVEHHEVAAGHDLLAADCREQVLALLLRFATDVRRRPAAASTDPDRPTTPERR